MEQITDSNSKIIIEDLGVNIQEGLSSEEALARLDKFGPNAFEEKKRKTRLQMFLAQLRNPMIYILFAAVLLSAALQEFGDSLIIVAIILLNGIIGMVQEAKAEDSLEALKKMSSPMALVRRDGKLVEVEAPTLVPGDVVILEAGRIIPADLLLTKTVNLKIEEAALTGESVPVEKDASFLSDTKVSIGDRLNQAYMSTNVAYGRGEGVVTATGMSTEIGKIAKLISEGGESMTPLQKRLGDLGKLLGIVAVVLCVGLFGIAMIQSRDLFDMLLTAIALAVAAIPEGLPAVVTIVLALGVQRMVKVNTIVRKLPAVETLGSVSIVCSDKTGTLTQNKMTVTETHGNESELIQGMALCTDASIQGDTRIGDPTELALVDIANDKGFIKDELEKKMPRINEQAFDSTRKMMTTVHRTQEGKIVAFTKGATDQILERCTHYLDGENLKTIDKAKITEIESVSKDMASRALRVLGLAIKYDDETATEKDLIFVGLVGMIDPPRLEAKDAVQVFKEASITTIMITGDHKDTALAIAKELNIAENDSQCLTGDELDDLSQEDLNQRVMDYRIFARVSPEHKVMIVKAFKSHGHIVAMTGDGVNDAPSLQAADIGVAMGISGTDVAKSAADMVLTDDNFATIEKAIEEGRNIYGNIRKSVLFLLSSNFGEIITMFVAILIGMAAPLKAIHILWVNLITDSLPGLALGVDPGNKDIMKDIPRNPQESLFANGGYFITFYFGTVIAAITLFAFIIAPGEDLATAQTYAFTVLAVSQLFNAIGMRDLSKSVFKMNHFNNRMMIVAFFVGIGLQVLVTEIDFLNVLFETSHLTLEEWLMLGAISTGPLWAHELLVLGKMFKKKYLLSKEL
ncbi:MAG: cation-translocating P-type ATPase [Anaerovoracaceae bacterium]|nr:cation-translocating P-type ATPase [Anaerovoracaceae bacterium]